ncbi:MAG TPA: FAD-binding oxidoreductase [Terriglobales bacterium]|nr:FAD-binding oxidoreductase [Terriglobales bacterium]
MNTALQTGSLARELAAICGAQHVEEDPALEAFAIDGMAPAVAVSPATAQEAANVIAFAAAQNLTVVPAGGFTAMATGGIPERISILLRTTRLEGVTHYDPADLTIGVGAGCTLATLDSVLAEHGQFLPLDPPHPEHATVGGTLAAGVHGPLKHGYGGMRDFCVGIQFVTGEGKLAKGGGRVVKNVAGYDLMKLMIGSYGSLGIIVEANFKVFPRQGRGDRMRTFVLEFTSLSGAIHFRNFMRGSHLTPLCLELVSPRAQEYLTKEAPAPRDPDDYAPAAPGGPPSARWRILLRAAGSEAVLARYRKEMGINLSAELSGGEDASTWKYVSNFEAAVLERHRNAMFARMNVSPAEVEAAIGAAEQAGVDNNLLLAVVGRAGLGALVLAFIPLSVDPPSAMQYANTISALRSALSPDSAVVVTRCPQEAKWHFNVWGSTPTDLETMRAIKRALDPKGILNRGRFLV